MFLLVDDVFDYLKYTLLYMSAIIFRQPEGLSAMQPHNHCNITNNYTLQPQPHFFLTSKAVRFNICCVYLPLLARYEREEICHRYDLVNR